MFESLKEEIEHKTKWQITKFASDEDYSKGKPFEVKEFDGNLLLNEGISELEKLGLGLGATAWGTASYLGVGDSTAAAAATQTGLQATTNKTYVVQDAGYPTEASQVMTWRATYASTVGNHDWQEFTVVNASSDTGKNLNRKVSNQGAKSIGQTWILTCTITLS